MAELFLRVNKRFNLRFDFVILVVNVDHSRAADDQRRARFINQDRVHFVHDGVVMAALHLFLLARGHAVVAQVIEPELRVRAVSDVAVVLFATDRRRLVVQDATDRQTEKLINRAHPLAVARGEVIVHRDDVHATAGQRVQINRERRDQCLAFARGHFRDATAVQRVAADELHIERDHFPLQRMTAHDDLLAAQSPAGVLHRGESFGQDFIQRGGQFGVVFDFAKPFLPGRGFFAQGLGRLRLERRFNLVDLRNERPQPADFPVVLRPDNFSDDKTNHSNLKKSWGKLREEPRSVKGI